MLDDLSAAANANAVVAEVRRRGDSYYLRSLEPPADNPDYAPSFDALQYLVERAHARGVEARAGSPCCPWARRTTRTTSRRATVPRRRTPRCG